MTGQQLIEHCAKSIDISRAADALVVSHSLFRRHVTGRAQYFHRACDGAFSLDQSRQPEVGQMRFAFGIEQDVPWFDVAMKNAVLVRIVNSSRHLDNQFDRLSDQNWLTLDDCVKLAAFNKFHAE